MKTRLGLTAATSILAICVGLAMEQAHADAAGGSGLEEIVVTAQKRQQKLSDVGMTVTAVTGEQLQERGLTDVQDLVKIEPSLQYTESNNGLPVYTLRGVGFYDQSLASASTVSLYLDEAPYAFSALSRGAMLDVERVEVLKGPQGTLYGQNATGGAVNFISAQPTPTLTAGVDATYGRFGAASFGGFVSGPLSDTLAARLAVRTDQGGAWQTSDTRDDSLGDKDFKTGRFLLNWTPDTTFRAKLNLNGFTDDSESQAAQQEGFRLGDPAYVSSNPNAFVPNSDLAAFANAPAGIKAQLANQPAPNNPQAADWVAGTHPRDHERYFEGTLRFDYDPSDALGFTSLSKYETYSENNTTDLGGLNVVEIVPNVHGNIHSVGQELRAHGMFDDKKADWIVGLNYADDIGYENEAVQDFASGSYLTGGSPYSPLPGLGGQFTFFGALHNSETTTKSVFGNINYHVLDSINIHGGIRYTRADETASSCSYVKSAGLGEFLGGLSTLVTGTTQPAALPGQCDTFLPNGTMGLFSTKLDEHNVPWRVGVDWKPAPSDLIYATVSKGFKAGGSPALGASSWLQLKPVVQESVLAYEAGFKSSLFDRSVKIDGAVFYYDYTNKQFQGRLPDPLGIFGALQALVNIPKSEETGAELAVSWRPIPSVTLNAAGTYLETKIDSSFVNYSPYVTGLTDTINLKGEHFPFAPKWSLSAGARYDWTVNDNWLAYASANGTFQSSTVAAFGAAKAATVGPAFNIDAYAIVDLAVGAMTADDHWQIQVWGKNVTNKYYVTNIFYQFDNTVKYAGMPATYGLTVNYRY